MGATAAYDVAGDMTNSHLATGLAVGMSYDAAHDFNSVTIPTTIAEHTMVHSNLWTNGAGQGTLGNGLLEEVA